MKWGKFFMKAMQLAIAAETGYEIGEALHDTAENRIVAKIDDVRNSAENQIVSKVVDELEESNADLKTWFFILLAAIGLTIIMGAIGSIYSVVAKRSTNKIKRSANEIKKELNI